MATKFDRRYVLKVDVDPTTVTSGEPVPQSTETITLPYTCEFSMSRQVLAASSDITIRIFNLNESTRTRLYKDPYWPMSKRFLEFSAGYADFPLPRIFYGLLLSCTSYRDGVNSITEFQATSMAFDAPLADENLNLPPGQTAAQILRLLNAKMPGINPKPLIGPSFDKIIYPGPYAHMGKVWQAIRMVSNGFAIVDNNTVVALNDNEAVAAPIPVLNSSSGILNTPKRGQFGAEVSMIFEPRLTMQQVVQLDSSFNTNLNGTYKVYGFKHAGTISPRVCGTLTTDATLFRPGLNYNPFIVTQ